jgi:coenzyme F420 biosynthesis associated uncharacterized protein
MDRMESTETQPAPAGRLINWELAAGTAGRMVPAGPRMGRAEISAAVENLRELADASVGHVHRITGLEAARGLRDSQLLVVDRASWARANTQSFQALLAPAVEHIARTRADVFTTAQAGLASTATGAQFGAILAFLASKVLGQYDPFAPPRQDSAGGRLLLVAPNIISVERELNVEPADFRLWVCLHEQTHRVQFAAAPWLKDHLSEHIGELTGGLIDKADSLPDRLADIVRNLPAGRGREAGNAEPAGGGLLSLIQDPADRDRLSHLTAVMSLLEGHANVVMDAVDATVVPSVKTIRRRFNTRTRNRGPVESFIRRAMGLDAKMRQYADGARFVRFVVDREGMNGVNRVWESPANLPTEREIHAPDEWMRRVG